MKALATIRGTGGDDDITGTDAGELILGLAGDDRIDGGGGDDTIEGGSGQDDLRGGAGDDLITDVDGGSLFGGDGDDQLRSPDGLLVGGNGADTLIAGDDGVTLIGGGALTESNGQEFLDEAVDDGAIDTLTGGAGNDRLVAGLGDIVDGGDGSDSLIAVFTDLDEALTLDFRDGADAIPIVSDLLGGSVTNVERVISLYGTNFDDVIHMGPNGFADSGNGPANIYGGAGDDLLTSNARVGNLVGGDGDDTLDASGAVGAFFYILQGGAGNDTIIGSSGGDTISTSNAQGGAVAGDETVDGGLGFDIMDYIGVTADLTIDLDITSRQDIGFGTLEVVNVEQITGGDGDDTLYAASSGSSLNGGGGENTLVGRDGRDTFVGGLGVDTMTGGDGDDSYFYQDLSFLDGDVITDFGGADTLDFTQIVARGQSLTFIGRAAFSGAVGEVRYATTESGSVVEVDADGDGVADHSMTLDGVRVLSQRDVEGFYLESVEIVGSDASDALFGIARDELIRGLDGDDFIEGGGGDDVIEGGAGNDTISAGPGNATIDGGDGFDQIEVTVGQHTVDGGADFDELEFDVLGQAIALDLTGTDTGLSDATSGSQITFSNIEQLIIEADEAEFDDVFDLGSLTIDVLVRSDAGDDVITTGAGNDDVYGGAGDDEINTGDGDDRVTSDGDFLDISQTSGGTGNDTINTGDGNDAVYSGGGDDIVDLGAGDDFVRTLFGTNTLNGGDGTDQVQFFDRTQTAALDVVVTDNTFTDATSGASTSFTGFESVVVWSSFTLATNDRIDASARTEAIRIDSGLGDDEVIGGSGDDLVYAGEGDDTVSTGAGDDIVYGWLGDDLIEGGDGDDVLDGWEGSDTLYGQSGNDFLDGGAGDDLLNGGFDDDVIFGGDGNDFLIGQNGDDDLNGGAGQDSLRGGGGADRFEFFSVSDSAPGAANRDVILDFSEEDEIYLGFDADINTDGEQAFTLVGAFSNTAGEMVWDAGLELLSLDVDGDGVADMEITIQGTFTLDQSDFAQFISGTEGDDVLNGTAGDDQIEGLGGDDLIDGGGGDDEIYGGDGEDEIDGGDGDDTIEGGAGFDVLRGGAGDDVISDIDQSSILGGDGNDTLSTADGLLLGGNGADTLTAGDDGVTLIGGGAVTDFGIGEFLYESVSDGEVDTMIGGAGNDTFVTGLGDIVDGGDGEDRLRAVFTDLGEALNLDLRGDPDVVATLTTLLGATVSNVERATDLYGTNFDDVIHNGENSFAGGVGAGLFNIYGGGGDDLITSTARGANLVGEDGDDTLDASAAVSAVFYLLQSGAGNDTIIGSSGNDEIFTSFSSTAGYVAGDETVDGGAGFDTLDYANLSAPLTQGLTIDLDVTTRQNIGLGTLEVVNVENIRSGEGDDTLYASSSGGQLSGNGGDDTLVGRAGSDALSGGDGDDMIEGGAGGDLLGGGAGADTFIFNASAHMAGDTILDFDLEDRLDFSGISIGEQALTFIGIAAFSGAAGEVRSFVLPTADFVGITEVSIDIDGDGVADQTLTFNGSFDLVLVDQEGFTLEVADPVPPGTAGAFAASTPQGSPVADRGADGHTSAVGGVHVDNSGLIPTLVADPISAGGPGVLTTQAEPAFIVSGEFLAKAGSSAAGNDASFGVEIGTRESLLDDYDAGLNTRVIRIEDWLTDLSEKDNGGAATLATDLEIAGDVLSVFEDLALAASPEPASSAAMRFEPDYIDVAIWSEDQVFEFQPEPTPVDMEGW